MATPQPSDLPSWSINRSGDGFTSILDLVFRQPMGVADMDIADIFWPEGFNKPEPVPERQLTMIFPGDPPEVARQVGQRLSAWLRQQYGKEVTYAIEDKEEFARKTNMPARARRSMGVVAGDHFLVVLVLPDDNWDQQDFQGFTHTVSHFVMSQFQSILGDEGEAWKST